MVTPGTSFGACGEGYFRMSLTVPDAAVEEAVCRLQKPALLGCRAYPPSTWRQLPGPTPAP